MPERSSDWMNQAVRDLATAEEMTQGAHTNTLPERMLKMLSFVVEESLDSVRVFWLDQEKLLGELYRLAQEVDKRDENIIKIVLFGSLAEKRAVPGSDIDILVILRSDNKPFMDRLAEWSPKFPLDFPLQIFSYTQKELPNSIASSAMSRGITLFER